MSLIPNTTNAILGDSPNGLTQNVPAVTLGSEALIPASSLLAFGGKVFGGGSGTANVPKPLPKGQKILTFPGSENQIHQMTKGQFQKLTGKLPASMPVQRFIGNDRLISPHNAQLYQQGMWLFAVPTGLQAQSVSNRTYVSLAPGMKGALVELTHRAVMARYPSGVSASEAASSPVVGRYFSMYDYQQLWELQTRLNRGEGGPIGRQYQKMVGKLERAYVQLTNEVIHHNPSPSSHRAIGAGQSAVGAATSTPASVTVETPSHPTISMEEAFPLPSTPSNSTSSIEAARPPAPPISRQGAIEHVLGDSQGLYRLGLQHSLLSRVQGMSGPQILAYNTDLLNSPVTVNAIHAEAQQWLRQQAISAIVQQVKSLDNNLTTESVSATVEQSLSDRGISGWQAITQFAKDLSSSPQVLQSLGNQAKGLSEPSVQGRRPSHPQQAGQSQATASPEAVASSPAQPRASHATPSRNATADSATHVTSQNTTPGTPQAKPSGYQDSIGPTQKLASDHAADLSLTPMQQGGTQFFVGQVNINGETHTQVFNTSSKAQAEQQAKAWANPVIEKATEELLKLNQKALDAEQQARDYSWKFQGTAKARSAESLSPEAALIAKGKASAPGNTPLAARSAVYIQDPELAHWENQWNQWQQQYPEEAEQLIQQLQGTPFTQPGVHTGASIMRFLQQLKQHNPDAYSQPQHILAALQRMEQAAELAQSLLSAFYAQAQSSDTPNTTMQDIASRGLDQLIQELNALLRNTGYSWPNGGNTPQSLQITSDLIPVFNGHFIQAGASAEALAGVVTGLLDTIDNQLSNNGIQDRFANSPYAQGIRSGVEAFLKHPNTPPQTDFAAGFAPVPNAANASDSLSAQISAVGTVTDLLETLQENPDMNPVQQRQWLLRLIQLMQGDNAQTAAYTGNNNEPNAILDALPQVNDLETLFAILPTLNNPTEVYKNAGKLVEKFQSIVGNMASTDIQHALEQIGQIRPWLLDLGQYGPEGTADQVSQQDFWDTVKTKEDLIALLPQQIQNMIVDIDGKLKPEIDQVQIIEQLRVEFTSGLLSNGAWRKSIEQAVDSIWQQVVAEASNSLDLAPSPKLTPIMHDALSKQLNESIAYHVFSNKFYKLESLLMPYYLLKIASSNNQRFDGTNPGDILLDVNMALVKLMEAKGVGGSALRYEFIRHVDFSRVNLQSADLSNLILGDQDFTSKDLNKLKLKNSNLSNVLLQGANLTGVDFTNAVLGDRDRDFAGMILDNANFSNTDLTKVRLGDAAGLYNVKFIRAKLGEQSFVNKNLTWADFTEVDLSGVEFVAVNLSGAILYNANFGDKVRDFKDVNLTEAELDHVDLSKTDLQHAILKYTRFYAAILGEQDFRNKDLSDNNFSYVDLSEVQLAGANLKGANLIGATYEGEIITPEILRRLGAEFDENTQFGN